MNEKKSRTLLFFLGISIGLLVGATTVYVLTPKPSTNGEVSENMIEQIVNQVYGLISSKKQNRDSLSEIPQETVKISKIKSAPELSNAEKRANEISDSSSKKNEAVALMKDSTQMDSVANTEVTTLNFNEDIVVKKDELLSQKSVELVNLDYVNSKSAHMDSLLQAVSGIRDNSKMNEAKYMYQVELWKSPINYKGYRLTKNKLVLYGIQEEQPLKLFFYDDNTYLKCADVFYKLDNYNDYKAFEKVVNSQLIALLNK